MNNKPSLLKVLPMTGLMIFLSGCATGLSNHNRENLKAIDMDSQKLISRRIQQESEKQFNIQKDLIDSLTSVQTPTIELEPIEPAYNPLDATKISLQMRNGDIQDAFRAIASQAGLNLLMDPEIIESNRKVSLNLIDIPASQAFEYLMDLMDFNGQIEGNVLIIRPYVQKVFALDFMPGDSTLKINLGGDVFGANTEASEGTESMSGFLSLEGEGNKNNDPYEELGAMLDTIIGKKDEQKTDRPAGTQLSLTSSLNRPGYSQNRQPTDRLNTTEDHSGHSFYSLNPVTGTLIVKGRPSQVQTISDLVKRYKDILSRQIVIEAQILDISLNDNFSFGVDWAVFGDNITSTYGIPIELGEINSQLPGGGIPPRDIVIPGTNIGSTNGDKSFSTVFQNDHFTAIADMMQKFGTVRVLSNPILRVKNTRPSFITVGRNTTYIAETSSDVTDNGGSSTTSIDITTSSVFDGIILAVEPFIADDGTIHLTVHPIQSEVLDSSLALIDVGTEAKVSLPVVDFKGLTTSLSLRSGDTVVLGGLTDEIGGEGGGGIPILSDITGIGALFGSQNSTQRVRELVIVMRVRRL